MGGPGPGLSEQEGGGPLTETSILLRPSDIQLYFIRLYFRSNYFPQLELPKKVGPSQPEVGPSHSHPSLSAYTRARGMDHSPPITLDAHHGTGRAINRFPSTRAVAKPSKKLAPRRSKVAPRPPTRHDASVCHRAGSNGFTHISGTHLDDARPKTRRPSPPPALLAPRHSPLLTT